MTTCRARFRLSYRIEFLSPNSPEGLAPADLEDAMAHLIDEWRGSITTQQEAELRRHARLTAAAATGSPPPPAPEAGFSITLGEPRITGFEELSPRPRIYYSTQSARFNNAPDDLDLGAALRAHLIEALGVEPRQFEGPFNFLEVTIIEQVEADTDAAPLSESGRRFVSGSRPGPSAASSARR